jgi:hypothetical protein
MIKKDFRYFKMVPESSIDYDVDLKVRTLFDNEHIQEDFDFRGSGSTLLR